MLSLEHFPGSMRHPANEVRYKCSVIILKSAIFPPDLRSPVGQSFFKNLLESLNL